MRVLRYCCVIVKKDEKLLLCRGKLGRNKDKWVFPGSFHQARFGTLQDTAIKSLKNQCGILASTDQLAKVGRIELKYGGMQELIQMHVFILDNFQGDLKETRGVQPEWFHIKDIPTKDLWADVTFWLGAVLGGQKVKGFFIYENENVLYKELSTVPLPSPSLPLNVK